MHLESIHHLRNGIFSQWESEDPTYLDQLEENFQYDQATKKSQTGTTDTESRLQKTTWEPYLKWERNTTHNNRGNLTKQPLIPFPLNRAHTLLSITSDDYFHYRSELHHPNGLTENFEISRMPDKQRQEPYFTISQQLTTPQQDRVSQGIEGFNFSSIYYPKAGPKHYLNIYTYTRQNHLHHQSRTLYTYDASKTDPLQVVKISRPLYQSEQPPRISLPIEIFAEDPQDLIHQVNFQFTEDLPWTSLDFHTTINPDFQSIITSLAKLPHATPALLPQLTSRELGIFD